MTKSDQHGNHNDSSQIVGNANTLDKRIVFRIENLNIYITPGRPPGSEVGGSPDLLAQFEEMMTLVDPISAVAVLQAVKGVLLELRRSKEEELAR